MEFYDSIERESKEFTEKVFKIIGVEMEDKIDMMGITKGGEKLGQYEQDNNSTKIRINLQDSEVYIP